MKTALLGVCLALLSVTAAQAIDCAKADNDLDHAICDNPDLLKADDAMNAAYQSALKAIGPKMAKVLKADAVEWAEYRYEDCAGNSDDVAKPEEIATCLTTDTQKRVSYLSGMPYEGPGIGEAMLPQVRTGADDVFNEYLRFTTPKSPTAKAFNAALDKDLKGIRVAKTTDHVSDYFQLQLYYASPDLISADIDQSLEEGYAHPIMSNYSINLDGKTGKELAIADLLDDAGIKAIEANCADQLKDYIAAGGEGSDVRADNVKGMVDSLTTWTFGATKATLQYVEYDADAYHTCFIGYDALKPLAKPSFPLPH